MADLPNWAIFPVMLRSVSTDTMVFAPSARRLAVMLAEAFPAPELLRPFASMTAR